MRSPQSPGPLTGRSLLAVFAHPDDESIACGGLLAWCASLGVRVSLLCATSGEAGPGAEAALGETRAKELEAAGRTLGLSEIVLLDCEDGMLTWTEDLDATIEEEIRRLAPDVVITFGEDGLYWHPDHVAMHHKTTAAVNAIGAGAPALYYVTMAPGSMRAVVDHAMAKAADTGGPPRLVLGIADPDSFGAEASEPTLVVDVGDFAATKLAAIKCHRTQLEHDALVSLDDEDAKRFLAIEHYRRAEVGAQGPAFIERFSLTPNNEAPRHRDSE